MTSFSIRSTQTDYTYSVEVYVPEGNVPDCGFPVIYVLDGLSYFEFLKDAVRLQSKNSMKTKTQAAIVVGISHDAENMHARRFYDFTGPATVYTIKEALRSRIPEKVGGASHFYQFIETELKPFIEKNYVINKAHQTLFGHSLGGYFALWCLFVHPKSFKNYIAISPSVWWNDYELYTYTKNFIKTGLNQDDNSLFIGVGEMEGSMVVEANNIYQQLHAQRFNVVFYEALEENHASVVPTVMSRALRFVNQTTDVITS